MLLLLVFDLELFDVPVKRDNGEERKLLSSFSWAALGFLNHVIFAEGTFVPLPEQEASVILVKCVETTFYLTYFSDNV